MATLLVTGGAGFIGANFTHYWFEGHPGDRIVVLDALTYAGDSRNLQDLAGNARFHFVHGDIADQALVEKLLREHDVDTLVHFAAESHVDRSIANADAFVATNIVGTYSLLEAARRVWLCEAARPHRFHHVSTDEVYGSLDADAPPWNEHSAYAPNSPYAASKAAADHLVRAYARTHGLSVTTSNCSNNYGPRQYPEKLIPLAIVRLLCGRPMPLYGDGENMREWLHVHDHCRGIELVLNQGNPCELYHLGGGTSSTNRALLQMLCALVDERFKKDAGLARQFPDAPAAKGISSWSLVRSVADRPGHDFRYAVDGGKAKDQLGFEPRIGIEQGLADTVAWYLENHEWWRAKVG
jgi:dTDP-glucose 4,6-dehydratase